MFHRMKMLSFKRTGFILIIMAIIGMSCIYLYGNSAYNYYNEPVQVDVNDLKDQKNKYVKFDMDDVMIMNCFMEKKQESLFGKSDTFYYYVIGIKDDTGNLKCIVCVSDKAEKELFDTGLDNFNKKIKGKSGSKKIHAKKSGILLKMDSFLVIKLREYLATAKINMTDKVYYEPYYISEYKPDISDVVIFGFAVLLLLYSLIELFIIAIGGKQRKIRRKIKRELGKDAVNMVERDYELSRFFNKDIRIGDIYIYLFSIEGSTIIKLTDIVWVYECEMSGEGKGKKTFSEFSGIELWDVDFESYKIYAKDRTFIDGFLEYIVSVCSHTVVGYNEKLENMFLNENDKFKNIVFNRYTGGLNDRQERITESDSE